MELETIQEERNNLFATAHSMTTSVLYGLMEGRQIKAARALLGWSQSDLCGEARISRATLNDMENNIGDPRRSSTTKVEKAFANHGVVFVATGEICSGGSGVRMKE